MGDFAHSLSLRLAQLPEEEHLFWSEAIGKLWEIFDHTIRPSTGKSTLLLTDGQSRPVDQAFPSIA